MKIKTKRAYDNAARNDGFRVLVDRLWPRGVTKKAAKIDLWAKEVAPSKELRSWFHADKQKRLKDFSKRYKNELIKHGELAALQEILKNKKTVTIVTAVKDIEHSHIPILLKHLNR